MLSSSTPSLTFRKPDGGSQGHREFFPLIQLRLEFFFGILLRGVSAFLLLPGNLTPSGHSCLCLRLVLWRCVCARVCMCTCACMPERVRTCAFEDMCYLP